MAHVPEKNAGIAQRIKRKAAGTKDWIPCSLRPLASLPPCLALLVFILQSGTLTNCQQLESHIFPAQQLLIKKVKFSSPMFIYQFQGKTFIDLLGFYAYCGQTYYIHGNRFNDWPGQAACGRWGSIIDSPARTTWNGKGRGRKNNKRSLPSSCPLNHICDNLVNIISINYPLR